MKKNLVLILLIVITLFGGFLRIYKNTQNPPGLNGDEVSMAYDAYSILQTGKDQYGKFMPLTFQSVGDYKNPVPIYLMVLPIKLFGLNDFSVRLQNAFFGTLLIPIFFFFLLNITKRKDIAIVGACLMAFSAWMIYYSRLEYEYVVANVFVLLGIWLFIRMFEKGRWSAFLSAFFLILTMYTAPADRLFIPLFIFASLIYSLPKFKKNKDKFVIFIATCVILVLPLIYATLFLGAGTRLSMVLISNDIEYHRYIAADDYNPVINWPLLIFFWLKRFLNYLQPEFLFNGLNITPPGTIGLGMLYLFELPFLFLGVVEFIKQKIPYKTIFIIWFLTGIVPDSITNNQQHAGRLLQIAPVLIFIISLGAIKFYKMVMNISKTYIRLAVISGFGLFVCLVLIHAFLVFAVHFPWAKGEVFDEGLKETSLYINDHQSQYQKIVVDPRRGIWGPYIITNSYLYFLFYAKYDPHTYQTETKVMGTKFDPTYSFSKYEFRYIDWSKDQVLKNTLFIGSPWSFPHDLPANQILKKVYLTTGEVAFYIVSPN